MSPRCRAAKPPAAHGLVFFALRLVPTPTPTLNDLSDPCRGIIGPRRGHRPEDAGVLVAKQLDAAWLVLLQEFTYGLLATTIAPAAFSPKLRAKIFSSATCSLSDPGPRSNAASPRRLGACVWAVAMWPASIAGRRGNWWKGEIIRFAALSGGSCCGGRVRFKGMWSRRCGKRDRRRSQADTATAIQSRT